MTGSNPHPGVLMAEAVVSPEWARRPRIFDHPQAGHYESWFIRANAPQGRQAFWIRYTLFVSRRHAQARLAEVWALYFDGQRHHVAAAQQDILWDRSQIEPEQLNLNLDGSTLSPGKARGQVAGRQHRLSWDLSFGQGQGPLLLLPQSRYEAGFPKAKSLVTQPLARFQGRLTVDGAVVDIEDWWGSENHNWGQRHTDAYAWGQVCGFDNESGAFLECASAQVRLGAVWTPRLTLAVLRLRGETLYFNQLSRAIRNRGEYNPGHWSLACGNGRDRLSIEIASQSSETAALYYKNPPGGGKTCLNSKLASCTAILTRPGSEPLHLTSQSGAAFEILTDAKPPLGLDYANA